MHTIINRRKPLLVTFLVSASLSWGLQTSSLPTAAQQTVDSLQERQIPIGEVKDGSGTAGCATAAASQTLGAWICIGDQLRYLDTTKGTGTWLNRQVVGGKVVEASEDTASFDTAPSTLYEIPVNEADAPLGEIDTVPSHKPDALDSFAANASDDYDYWCENRSWCARKISNYIAEVKGNAAYGIGTQVIGRFDVIWRQNFNGPYARWRLLLIWDAGPAVDSNFWRAQVRRERLGPDDIDSYAHFWPATISALKWRAYTPSRTSLKQTSSPVKRSGGYHDDLYGYFYANGRQWSASVLHTGRWQAKRINGKYRLTYSQVPWKD